jgi:HEPN domain-containing protein
LTLIAGCGILSKGNPFQVPYVEQDVLWMPNRAKDWFAQAERDLEQAKDSKERGHHEWACFAAQQAAEKAVKALHLSLGQEAWGHVVARLLRELPIPVDPVMIEKAKVLDNAYVPSRYPNSHPEGAPFEHYGPIQSDEAIRYAGEIIAFVHSQMA